MKELALNEVFFYNTFSPEGIELSSLKKDGVKIYVTLNKTEQLYSSLDSKTKKWVLTCLKFRVKQFIVANYKLTKGTN